MKTFIIKIFTIIILQSCSERMNKPENHEIICSLDQINTQTIVELSGVMIIDSKGDFIFKGENHDVEGRGSGTYLVLIN